MYDAIHMTTQSLNNVTHLQMDCLDEPCASPCAQVDSSDKTRLSLCPQTDSLDKTHIPPCVKVDSSDKTCLSVCPQTDSSDKTHVSPCLQTDSSDKTHVPPCVKIDSSDKTHVSPCPQTDSSDKTHVPPCVKIDSSDKTHVPPYVKVDSSDKTCLSVCPQTDSSDKTHVPPCVKIDSSDKTRVSPCPQNDSSDKTRVSPCPQTGSSDKTRVSPCPQNDSSDKTRVSPCPQNDSSDKARIYPCLQADYLSKIHTTSVSEQNDDLNGQHTIYFPLKDLVNSKKQESLWWNKSCVNLQLSLVDENLEVTVLSIKPQLLDKETYIDRQSSTTLGSESVPHYKKMDVAAQADFAVEKSQESWKSSVLELDLKNVRERKFMDLLLPENLKESRSVKLDWKGKALSQSVDKPGDSSEPKLLRKINEEIELTKDHSRTSVMNKLIKYPKPAVSDQVNGFKKPVQQINPMVAETPEESLKINLPVADVNEKIRHKDTLSVDTVEEGLSSSQSLLVNFVDPDQMFAQTSHLVCTKNSGGQDLSQVAKSFSKSLSQKFTNEYVPEASLSSVQQESSDEAGQSSSDHERQHLQGKISPLKTVSKKKFFDQTSRFNNDSICSVNECDYDSNSQAAETNPLITSNKDVYQINGHEIPQGRSTAVKDIQDNHKCILISQDNKNGKQTPPVNDGIQEGGNHISKHLDECGGANDVTYLSSDDQTAYKEASQIKNDSKLHKNILDNHSLLRLATDNQASLNQIDDDQTYQVRNDQMSKNNQNQVSDLLESQVSDDGDDPYVLLDYQRMTSAGGSEMIPRAYNHSLNFSFDEDSFLICEDIKSLENTNVLSKIHEKTLSVNYLEKLGDKSKNTLHNSSQQIFDHLGVEQNTEISEKIHSSELIDHKNLCSDTEFYGKEFDEENSMACERNTDKPLSSYMNCIPNMWNDACSSQTCVSSPEMLECCSYRNVVNDKDDVKSNFSICSNVLNINESDHDENKRFLHSTLKVKETEKCTSHDVSGSKHGDDESQLFQELVCDNDASSSDADWMFAEELVAPLEVLGNVLTKSHSFEQKDTKVAVSENSEHCVELQSELCTKDIQNSSEIIFRRKRLFPSSRSNSQLSRGVNLSPRCILNDRDMQQRNNLSYCVESSGDQHIDQSVFHSQKFKRVKKFQRIRKIFDSSDSEEKDYYPSNLMKEHHHLLLDQSGEEDYRLSQKSEELLSRPFQRGNCQELSSHTVDSGKYNNQRIHENKDHKDRLDKYSNQQCEEEPDLEFNNLDDETCEEPTTDLPPCSDPIIILSEESQTSGNEDVDDSEAMNRVIANVQADLNCKQTSHSFKNLSDQAAPSEEPASLSGWSGITDVSSQAESQMKKEIEQMYKKIMILEAQLSKSPKNDIEGKKNEDNSFSAKDVNRKTISSNPRIKNQTFVSSQQKLLYSQKTRRRTDDQRLALRNLGTKEDVFEDFARRGNLISNTPEEDQDSVVHHSHSFKDETRSYYGQVDVFNSHSNNGKEVICCNNRGCSQICESNLVTQTNKTSCEKYHSQEVKSENSDDDSDDLFNTVSPTPSKST
ncbi:uncharacterized protein LOC111086511 [Limulus polyphemus]|uniref:Uncharacterized protein LOC111086511 n=1 Tax=Limulus polyphemus TaxID=6850 RepID=A0ABM1SP07_LIMPO|nr:uncharacterized protein LOC111086511 [Limulus polyphemus]